MTPPRTTCLLGAALVVCSTGQAQQANDNKQIDQVVITSQRVAPEAEISGDELRERMRGTLGATLDETLGVANASFGAGVGLPVIRGLQGSRVFVSINGTGSHDASTISPDHAIPIEPLLADRIRVWRGPAAILFGGSAIGGAVEIDDGRIPQKKPDGSGAGSGAARYDSGFEEYAAAAKLDAQFGAPVLHFGGFMRERSTMKIPGRALDEDAIRQQFGLLELRNSTGQVDNSDAESRGGNLGGSWIGDWGHAGIALSESRYQYGIPPGGHPAHSHGAPPTTGEVIEEVRLDMQQTRVDMAVELDKPFAWIEKLELRGATVDYRHDELEQRVTATTFRNDVRELRLDVTHMLTERITALTGAEFVDRDFSAMGAEEFVPPVTIRSGNLFVLARLQRGRVEAEAGWRWETHETELNQESRLVGGVEALLPQAMKYETVSASAGITFQATEHFSARLSAQRAQRAPEINEMLALGPHLATRSFDIGNLDLDLETATSAELALDARALGSHLQLTLFGNRMQDFIYQQSEGYFFDLDEQLFRARCVRLEECLPVLGYRQQDARFYGAEVQLSLPVEITNSFRAALDVFGDFSRGQFVQKDAGDVPRQPAPRVGVELRIARAGWSGKVRWTHAFDQDRPALGETTTEGYDLINVSAERGFRLAGLDLLGHATVRNVLDSEIRNSVSFLRSFAPEPGRSIEIGLRLSR